MKSKAKNQKKYASKIAGYFCNRFKIFRKIVEKEILIC